MCPILLERRLGSWDSYVLAQGGHLKVRTIWLTLFTFEHLLAGSRLGQARFEEGCSFCLPHCAQPRSAMCFLHVAACCAWLPH